MIDINGKWAMITGASRGIGRQVATAMAKRGCNIILHSRKKTNTDAIKNELTPVSNIKLFQIEAELSDINQVKQLASEAQKLSGGLDILYNNAAIMTAYHEDYLTTVEDEYILSFRVNTIAPITLSNAVLPEMIKKGFGRIVNVTSGIKDQPELMAYAASKAALDKYVRDMAPKLKATGKDVLMNLMDPGWLRTDLGGPNAPNAVESVVPGALIPVLLDNGTCGEWFSAQTFSGLCLKD